MVNRVHGTHALFHVADRITALEAGGDLAGVARWREIGARLDQLGLPEAVQ